MMFNLRSMDDSIAVEPAGRKCARVRVAGYLPRYRGKNALPDTLKARLLNDISQFRPAVPLSALLLV